MYTDLISAWRRCSFSVARWTARVCSVCACVRACVRANVKCKCKCKGGGVLIRGMLLDEERGETHGDDIFVSLAESLESVGLYGTVQVQRQRSAGN